MEKTVIEIIKVGKSGAAIFRRYEHALPNALSKFDVDFSYPEIFDVISTVEADGIENDDQKLEQRLVDGLAEKAVLHGGKSDVALWIAFICECYRQRKELTVKETHHLFRKYGVYHFLGEFYPAFHTVGEQFVIRRIDEYIDKRS